MEDNNIIGRVVATEKVPTTIDNFTFWTKQDLILNPFDIVKVESACNSYSYGVIEDIAHITDSQSFLSNYISSDFGDVNINENTIRVGMNYVSAKVISNDKNIYIPLQNNKPVMLANKDEINYALGLKDIKNPLVCGYIEMYEGTQGAKKVTLPVNLNSKFLIGPEGAHLNISGISGLAAKTSYAMFLLKAIQDYYLKEENNIDNEESVAYVLFNVKGRDILAIDKENDFTSEDDPIKAKEETIKIYKELGLSPLPFKNVRYYYPYFKEGEKSNTYMSSEDVKDNIELKKGYKFKYTYEEDKDNLDLLFSNIEDTTQTMDSIINYIITEQGDFGNVSDWNELISRVKDKTIAGKSSDKEIPVVSWRKFYRIINKIINDGSGLFANRVCKEKGELRIEDAIKNIKKNEVQVIDIAKLSEDKQSYVFGSTIRAISKLQLGEYIDENITPPSKIIIFIDELNKYASQDTPKTSPILRQLLDIVERGRSLGIILFSAEQFRSAIHSRVTGNSSTHAYGRTNSIETSKKDYNAIPPVYKTMLSRLKQGEYIIENPVFRSLLNIKFPKPIYKQFK